MLANGTLLQNRYLIKRPLAQGGMGAIYEAEAIHLGHAPVAVKETFFVQDWLREQFQREASMLARLRHPALPKVSDHFVEDAGQFLVMEFIPGEDLEKLLESHIEEQGTPFDWQRVVKWADRLLDALEYIHSQQPPVIHRDIKPQNLKLTPHGELFLIDFGLAKDATTPTSPGRSVHAYTPNYAPPEQLKGTGTDARTDLYSLGATLYNLLTGEIPIGANVREEVMRFGVPDPLRSVSEIKLQIPPSLSDAIARAMKLDRKDRYQNAKEMREALHQCERDYKTLIAEEKRRNAELKLRETKRLLEEERKRQEEARQRELEEKRRKEEEARVLAEQQRQEEVRKRQEEARQCELEEKRRKEEKIRRQVEKQIDQQKRLEQEQAEKSRGEEKAQLEELNFERKRKKEIERRKHPEQVTRPQSVKTSPQFNPRGRSQTAEEALESATVNPVVTEQAAEPAVHIQPAIEITQDVPNTQLMESELPTYTEPLPTQEQDKEWRVILRSQRLQLSAGVVAVLALSLFYLLWPYLKNETVSPQSQTQSTPLPTVDVTERLQYWFELENQKSLTTKHILAPDLGIKFHFKSRENGYLYLLALDQKNRLTAFLRDEPVQSGSDFVFPSNAEEWFDLSRKDIKQAHVTVLLARSRIHDFDNLVLNVGQSLSQAEAIESLKRLVGAILPITRDDMSERGITAIAVRAIADDKPLIFDIPFEYVRN
ncbi:MAG: protein kinase [Acidobacteria bacterium]|nr:protein kinase [Acidobacteriota bacterium]